MSERSSLPSVRLAMPVRVARYRSGAVFGPRRLPGFELFWMLSGSVTHSYETPWGAAGQTRLTPGMLRLSVTGTVDTYAFGPDRLSTHAFVHFRLDDPTVETRLGPVTGWPTVVDLGTWPAVAALAQYGLDLAGDRTADALDRTQHCIALMLDMIVRGPLVGVREIDPRLDALVEHVADEWARDGLGAIPGERLARAVGLSRGHLSLLVARHFGCGPAEMLELVRLAHAAVTLQRSNSSVAETAADCGFTNPFHFSHRFKRLYRYPPGAFRRCTQIDPYEPLRERQLLGVAYRLLQVRTWN